MQAELEKMQQTISMQKNGLPWEGQGPNPMVRIYSTHELGPLMFFVQLPSSKPGSTQAQLHSVICSSQNQLSNQAVEFCIDLELMLPNVG